ncbi:MAG: outer membrane protein assembly factor BamE [Nitrospinae bacterium]|nr:outer membrane protein assembly factor BamE [Nitrospinota bacterium]
MKLSTHQKAANLLQVFLTGMFLAIFLSACGTVGKNFDESLYANIAKGTTNQKDIHTMFGPPFKKGIQNGHSVWTYEYNYVNSFGTDIIKDMIIVFDKNGVVKSHQLMTSAPE